MTGSRKSVTTMYLKQGPNSFIYINDLRYRADDVALAMKALPAAQAAMELAKECQIEVLKDAIKHLRALLRHGYDWDRSDATIKAKTDAKEFIRLCKKVLK